MESINVLDHGSITLVNSMGDDLFPVQAARNSYASKMKGTDQDFELLEKLYVSHHDTPFEFVQMVWEVACPISVSRQWMRHRVWSYCEFSTRWGNPDNLNVDGMQVYMPSVQHLLDQGSGHPNSARSLMSEHYQSCIDLYKVLLADGIKRESARGVLPLDMYTRFWGRVDMRNLLGFLALRDEEHAQWEIRQYAKAMRKIAEKKWPRLMALASVTP